MTAPPRLFIGIQRPDGRRPQEIEFLLAAGEGFRCLLMFALAITANANSFLSSYARGYDARLRVVESQSRMCSAGAHRACRQQK